MIYRLSYYCQPYSSYSQYGKSIRQAVKLSFNRSLNMRLTSLLDDVIKMTLSSHTRLSWFQILTFAFMSYVLHTNSWTAPQQRYKLSYFVLFVVSTKYNALRAAILLHSATQRLLLDLLLNFILFMLQHVVALYRLFCLTLCLAIRFTYYKNFAEGVVVDLFYSAGKKLFVSTKVTVIVSAFYWINREF